MKRLKIGGTIVLILIAAIWIYVYLIPISSHNIFKDEEFIAATDREKLVGDSLINKLLTSEMNPEYKEGYFVKLPYGVRNQNKRYDYEITHITPYNKEVENEYERPFFQVTLIEDVLDEEEIERFLNTFLRLLAPSLKSYQISNVWEGDSIPLRGEGSPVITYTVISDESTGKSKHIIKRTYGEFVDESKNPFGLDNQPIDRPYSLNYKKGDVTNYSPSLWVNQLVYDLDKKFEWDLSEENLTTREDWKNEITVSPDPTNEEANKFVISSEETSFGEKIDDLEFAIPRVEVTIDRPFGSEEIDTKTVARVLRVLDPDVSPFTIDSINDYIATNSEVYSSEREEFEERDGFSVSLDNGDIEIRKTLENPLLENQIYNVADAEYYEVTDNLYDELLEEEEVEEEDSSDTSSYDLYSYSGSSTPSYSNDTDDGYSSYGQSSSGLNEDIKAALVTVTQRAVQQNEGFSGISWPWGFSDYNIKELAPDMYSTQGTFEYNGATYNFELIIMMRPDTSGEIHFYNVY